MMSTFHSLVNIHIASAIVSIVGFVWRWQLALRSSAVLQNKAVKILPHIIDTILLVSGIWLCVLIEEYPFVEAWLTAKLVLLIVYIGLGTVAIKRAKNNRQRMLCGILAIIVFAAIAVIAYSSH
ncbi:SirB2 family protein [Celerinatantimonas sp. MCCC 1A17872]|uniref:SirB2 family protein n=1 Tax=Celerinatantimonas sp. MCCC 1A17872 TaxID=3177514 RepID=UPI0038C0641E